MRKTLSMKYLAFVCCLLMMVSLLPATVVADNDSAEEILTESEESAKLREEIDELQAQEQVIYAQLQTLESKLSDNTAAIIDAVNQKDVLDQQIVLLYEQINNANAQISSYNQLIADKQEELDALLVQQDALQKKYKLRIRAMEERGELSYWNILFRASSITDLLDRINMIQQIMEADQRSLSDLRRTSSVVLALKDEMERNRTAVEKSRAQLDEVKLALEIKRTEANQILQDLTEKGAEYEALLLKSEEKQDQLLIQLAQKKSTYNRQAYEQWLANNQEGDGPDYYDDQWLSPLAAYRLTSVFGMRYHPVLKRNRMHNGIDMAAPADTPIYAARGGLVITAAYQKDGAGNYVQIDHGDGYRTIYMHMTRYIVQPGEYVAPGQVIGYVGSTGLSTGNHLHFGISLNGTYVNPLEYIPS